MTTVEHPASKIKKRTLHQLWTIESYSPSTVTLQGVYSSTSKQLDSDQAGVKRKAAARKRPIEAVGFRFGSFVASSAEVDYKGESG